MIKIATGDVTTFGPYSHDTIANVKTELEAASVVVADDFIVAPVEGMFFIIRIEA